MSDFPASNRTEILNLKREVDSLRQQVKALMAMQGASGKDKGVNPVLLGKAKEAINRGSYGTVGWWYGFEDAGLPDEQDSEIEMTVFNYMGDLAEGAWVKFVRIQDSYYVVGNVPGRYFALNPSAGAEVSGDNIYPHFAPIVGEHDHGLKITRNLSHPSASGKSVFVLEEASRLYKFHWDLSFISDAAHLGFLVYGTVGTLGGSYKALAEIDHQGGYGHISLDYWAVDCEVDAYLYLEISSDTSPVDMNDSGGITSCFEAERIL
jgi:hypothetical protein